MVLKRGIRIVIIPVFPRSINEGKEDFWPGREESKSYSPVLLSLFPGPHFQAIVATAPKSVNKLIPINRDFTPAPAQI